MGAPDRVKIRHILVPLDGTPLAQTAIAPSAALARALNAEITLLRAYGGQSLLPSGSSVLSGQRQGRGDDVHQASLYLARMQAELRGRGVRAASRVVQGHADVGILEVAAHIPADLIVIATRDGARARDRNGDSVTASLIRNGTIPVLVLNAVTANPFEYGRGVPLRVLLSWRDLHRDPTLVGYVTALASAFAVHVRLLCAPGEVVGDDSPAAAPDAHTAADPVDRLRESGIKVTVDIARTAVRRDALASTAYQFVDLVLASSASGAHGATESRAAVEGTLSLLHDAHLPVLIVP
jgi:nucleotide-binding universal stress UspA family protein